ncbi:ATP-binding protein [Catellatospora sp. KI3]|uniref:ATP-binding protein n=1 Tax=Catellatospora sp. KI3 TaxID=3041620 RepID=UPI0024826A5B|nr:ATP-binding protein [Catellatospora sp. KI3]MDI1460992.1 ATP-binding protein [Catellatospora sp. KI3]
MLLTEPRQDDHLTVAMPDRLCGDLTAPTLAWLGVAVAAVGGHHLALTGGTGTVRSPLAEAVAGLATTLSRRETERVAAVWRHRPDQLWLGRLCRPRLVRRDHTARPGDLLGCGDPHQPGAISLADAEVLVLDQAGRYDPQTVAALVAAMTTGSITHHGQDGCHTWPARFQAVFTSTPCGCLAHLLDRPCRQAEAEQLTYRCRTATLTQFADLRIDLDAALPCPHYGIAGKDLAGLRRLVVAATWRARTRMNGLPFRRAADLRHDLRTPPRWDGPALQRLRRRLARDRITAGQYTAVARVAVTLADIAGRAVPDLTDVRAAALLHGITV